MTVVSFHA